MTSNTRRGTEPPRIEDAPRGVADSAGVPVRNVRQHGQIECSIEVKTKDTKKESWVNALSW